MFIILIASCNKRLVRFISWSLQSIALMSFGRVLFKCFNFFSCSSIKVVLFHGIKWMLRRVVKLFWILKLLHFKLLFKNIFTYFDSNSIPGNIRLLHFQRMCIRWHASLAKLWLLFNIFYINSLIKIIKHISIFFQVYCNLVSILEDQRIFS